MQRRQWHPLQYSCLQNPMDRGPWYAAVHGVPRSRTWLSDFTFTFHFHALEKEMAAHFSVLAWRIPWTEEPGGLPSMGSHRVGHDWSNLAAAAADRYIHVYAVYTGYMCVYIYNLTDILANKYNSSWSTYSASIGNLPFKASVKVQDLKIPTMRFRRCMSAKGCPSLCNPVDCIPPGSSVLGILQERILA